MLPHLSADFTQMFSPLVTFTFTIEKQLFQVMNTNTASVNLLIGEKLKFHMRHPHVKVVIISETQANILYKTDELIKS